MELGSITAVFFFAVMAMQIPTGVIADIWHRRARHRPGSDATPSTPRVPREIRRTVCLRGAATGGRRLTLVGILLVRDFETVEEANAFIKAEPYTVDRALCECQYPAVPVAIVENPPGNLRFR